MRTFAAAAVLALLAVPAAAHAGGFATVGLDPAPAAAAPGAAWDARITVLQHGRTPAQGLRPTVLLRSGGEVERFTARPTGEPGVYAARVRLPEAGRWQVAVDEGFGVSEHRFGTIAVGGDARAPSAPADDGDAPLAAAAAVGVLTAVLTAQCVALLDRRRARRRVGGPSPLAS